MTLSEYTARREALVEGLTTSEQSIRSSDGAELVNRPIRELQLALSALDAEWQAQQSPSTPRYGIGRMRSGEGL